MRTIKRVVLAAFVGTAILASGVLGGKASAQTPSLPNLTRGPGEALSHPKIHNLFMSSSWDSDHPPELSQASINAFTQALANSDYLAAAAQYGVGPASFTGSDDTSFSQFLCPTPIVGFSGSALTSFFAIQTWVQCMTAPGPVPFAVPTLTGLPTPDADTLYVVYVPAGTAISDAGRTTCDDYGAYHFWSEQLVWQTDCTLFGCIDCIADICSPLCCLCGPFICGPVLNGQTFAFAVVAVECAHGSLANLEALATHEIIEAATDPIVPTGWIVTSMYHTIGDLVSKGEAADICEPNIGAVPTAPVTLTDGVNVATYWSDNDQVCVPRSFLFGLGEIGLPGTVSHQATLDGKTVLLPYSTRSEAGSSHSYAFPSVVQGPIPGTQYVTGEAAATVVLNADFSKTAPYTTQYFLTVGAAPPAAASLDSSLTPGGWINAGTGVTLTTDPFISPGAGSRFRFDHWSGGVSGTTATLSFVMSAPTSATANYVQQYFLTVRTSGLGASQTHVFNGSTLLGTASDASPVAMFVDTGILALNVDIIVNGPSGIEYFFQGFIPAAPTTLGAPFTTTAGYVTMSQLIAAGLASGGIHGPGAGGLTNSFQMQNAAVQADLATGNWVQALQDIQSFNSHLQAQDGKKVDPMLARTLELDALLVYHAALCRAVGTGQLDAASSAAASAYYTTLVSSLGGTVLTSCN